MKVDLDAQGWQLVLTILARAPYAEVANLINAITTQLNPQEATRPPTPLRAAAEAAGG